MIWYAFASYVTTYYDFLFTGDEAPWPHVLLCLLMGTSWEDCSHRPISCLRWGNWPCVWPLGWPWAPTDRRGKCNELCRWGHRAGLWWHHVDATLSVPHPWMMHILTEVCNYRLRFHISAGYNEVELCLFWDSGPGFIHTQEKSVHQWKQQPVDGWWLSGPAQTKRHWLHSQNTFQSVPSHSTRPSPCWQHQ